MTDYGVLSIFIIFVFIVSLFYFLQLPFTIYALIKRKNVFGYKETMYFEIPMRGFLVIVSLIYVLINGLDRIESMVFLLLSVWSIFALSQRITRIGLRNSIYNVKVYYPNDKVGETIEELVNEVENLQITQSVTDSPISILYSSVDPKQFLKDVETIENKSDLYQDLNNKKFDKYRIIYPAMFGLSVVFILGIMFVL